MGKSSRFFRKSDLRFLPDFKFVEIMEKKCDPMTFGLTSQKAALELDHPLEKSERNFEANRDKALLDNLTEIQGLAGPLILNMERRAVDKIGHLPCISSRSNLHADLLRGTDDSVSFQDVFGKPDQFEKLSMPHLAIEKQLGLL